MLASIMVALEASQTTAAEMPVISSFREALRLALQKRLRPFVTSDLALLAIVTDPYTKCALDLGKFGFTTAGAESNRGRAYSLLAAAIDKYAPAAPVPQGPAAPAVQAPVVRQSILQILAADLVAATAAAPGVANPVPVQDTEAEVKAWAEFTERPAVIGDLQMTSLHWWKQEQNRFNRVKIVARRHLGVQATSAASERLWSTATRVCSGNRSRMSAEHLQAIVRLHENLRRVGGMVRQDDDE